MKRLRHPIRAIREPFGTAGLIVAMIALVAALGGTALAAAKLNSTQKKEVEKIAKKYAGKPGAPGATGPAGPAGAAGKEGANGTNGAPGEKGATGNTGATGKSVKLINEAPTNCTEGGFTYEVEGSGNKNEVCDGEEGAQGPQGPQGPEGALGTAGTTLPTNATETGTWVADPNGIAFMEAPISFTIPLKSPLGESKVHYLETEEVEHGEKGKFGGGAHELCEGKTGTALTQCETEKRTLFKTTCAGSFETPKAASGNLCVYSSGTLSGASFLAITTVGSEGGASVPGALVDFLPANPVEGLATGSWAVTG